MPGTARRKAAEFERAVVFGVGERLIAAIAPAQAAEDAHLRRDFLLEVQAEAVFVPSLAPRRDDIRRRGLMIEKIGDRLPVIAHVGVVEIAQQPHGACSMRDQFPAGLQLEVFRARSRDIGVEVDAVRNLRHQCFGESRRAPMIVVFQDGAIGVTARVRGVVVRAIVVDRPVQELQVAVGAPGVQVEEIGQVELSDAELDAARGKGCGQMKLVAVGFDALIGKRDDLAQHEPRQIGSLLKVECPEPCAPNRDWCSRPSRRQLPMPPPVASSTSANTSVVCESS